MLNRQICLLFFFYLLMTSPDLTFHLEAAVLVSDCPFAVNFTICIFISTVKKTLSYGISDVWFQI